VAARALSLGCDVILDFGFWMREQRDLYKEKAASLGAKSELHYMDIPLDELRRRLALRNANPPDGAFAIPVEMMDRYISHFQHPTRDELRQN